MSEQDTQEPAQRAAVVAEALTWLGTPYHHHARIKGCGADCLMLLVAVFEHCGLVQNVKPGNYAHDWHLHKSEERYMHGLMRYCVQKPANALPLPGDIALFKWGRTYSHAGIVMQSPPSISALGQTQVLHAYTGRGVVLTRLREEPLEGRPMQIWSYWT